MHLKNKTWQKIGEVLLDYSKIFVAIGILSPFVKNEKVDSYLEYAIISMIVIFIVTGLFTFNKGANDE